MTARLRDVAVHAGVSVRTVSNVVNDFRYVSADTRARVQASITELGYRPNLAARTLRGSRTGLIALVVPEVDSPYFAELAACLVRRAETLSWTVLIDQTDGDPARERRLLHGIRAQLVDGLIFSPLALPVEELAARTDTVPLVLLGEHDHCAPVDHVGIDNSAAARTATEHLLARGRQRIAAIGLQPHLRNATARHRLHGFRAALAAAGRVPRPDLEITVPAMHRAAGYAAMQRLLAADQPPDSVFCFTDELALGALRAAFEHRVSVPRELAVVGFDDIEDGRFSTPSLTTIAPDKEAIAEVALDRLRRQLDRRGAQERVTTPHRLVVRESS